MTQRWSMLNARKSLLSPVIVFQLAHLVLLCHPHFRVTSAISELGWPLDPKAEAVLTEKINRILKIFENEKIYEGQHGRIILQDGYFWKSYKEEGRWLINGKTSFLFQPTTPYQTYTVKVLGFPYKSDDAQEWKATCADGEKIIEALLDEEGLTFSVSGGASERVLTLNMPCASHCNSGVYDKEKKRSFFMKGIKIYGENPL